MVATLLKVNLRMPESLYPIVSTFLLLGIGLKGGRELSEVSIDSFWKPLLAVLLLGLINPLIAFSLFRLMTRLDESNSAALAAHYGYPLFGTFMYSKQILIRVESNMEVTPLPSSHVLK